MDQWQPAKQYFFIEPTSLEHCPDSVAIRLQWKVNCLCAQTFITVIRVAVRFNGTWNDSKSIFSNITVDQDMGQLESSLGNHALICKLWLHFIHDVSLVYTVIKEAQTAPFTHKYLLHKM